MPDRTLVKVLAIDGGGIRGIIPALEGLARLAKGLTKDSAAQLAAVCKLVG